MVARSQEVIRKQVGLIVSYLRLGHLSNDDALATCSPGYRPLDWSPSSRSPYDVPSDYRPHPATMPRWESEVDRRADRWPRVLVVRLPELLRRLCVVDREIVEQVGRGWASYRHVGRQLRMDDHTVRRKYDAALIWLAEQLWDDDGAVLWD